MSGIRRVILVFIVAGLLSTLVYFIREKVSILRFAVVIVLVAAPFYFVIPYVGKYAEEDVPILYYRLFTRTEETLKGETAQADENRIGFFKQFQDEITTYLLPRGMVGNQFNDDPKTGIYMDYPLLALSHILGLPITLFIILFFTLKSYKSYLLYRVTSDTSPGVYANVTTIMGMLLFVEGTILVHPFTTPLTGLCLGKIIYYENVMIH